MPVNRLMRRLPHRRHQVRVREPMPLLHRHPAIGVRKMVVQETAGRVSA